jgi:hypothetical protein
MQPATHLVNSDGISYRSNRRRQPNPNLSIIALCCGINFLITSTKFFKEYLEKALLLTPSVQFSLACEKTT